MALRGPASVAPATVDSLSRAAVGAADHVLERVLEDCARRWEHHPEVAVLIDDLRSIVQAPAKRLRPLFVYWGYVGARGVPDPAPVARLAAAVELLHSFAIIHDDVMDGSPLRRGASSVHVRVAERHRRSGWQGERRRFSEGTAVLAGDLAFSLTTTLVDDLPQAVRKTWHLMCEEMVVGQHLDLQGAAVGAVDPQYIESVARLKSGLYSVVRPLQLGAALAGEDAFARCHDTYLRYGEPLGLAFQFRDDIIGVLGDPLISGKPAGQDLREGKPTLLLHLARQGAPLRSTPLFARIGQGDLADDEIGELIDLVVSTGALEAVEDRIAAEVARARDALDGSSLDDWAQRALDELAVQAGWRQA